MTETTLEQLTQADFEKCLNQKFLIHVEEQDPLETELVEVRGLPAPPEDTELRKPFSLVFRGPKDIQLQQSTFTVSNETLGKLNVFVVTIGPDDEGMRHETIFA
ncbi:MAG: hypothetical protein AAF560_05590 [Acidobacteriota bacterium]